VSLQLIAKSHHFREAYCMFRDRVDAGQQLAKELVHYANREDVLILGIPRGGVPVAFEVAQALHAPLDIVLVRKLGTPGQEELAMGAIARGGICILNQQLVAELGITDEQVADAIAAQEAGESGCIVAAGQVFL
jgi:putative phosphoribosyl transferase